MQLSIRFLQDVASVNSFEPVSFYQINEGDQQTLYFTLIDASLDRSDQMFNPAGRRYIPATGSQLKVTFFNLDDVKKVVRVASNPFPGDTSIWSVPILSSDPIRGTSVMNIELKEPTRTLNAKFANGSMLRVA
jgi:hypothetical protein